MKNGLTMQKFNIMKNYSKYICLFLLVLGTSTSAWGDAITTSELDFGTAAVSVNFNSLSATSVSATSSTTYNNGSMSGFTPFTHYYMGSNTNGAQSIAIAESSGAMTNNHMAFTITNNGVATSFDHSFQTKGAFSFKVLKTSTVNIGIYSSNAYATGSTYFAHNSAAVMLQCSSSAISVSAGQNSGTPKNWQTVTESLPSNDVLEIHVIYNNTGTDATYGDGISLGANSAHVYINGSAIMDGDAPKAMYIKGNTLTSFRICGMTASTSAKIDDIAIYDALPTKAGDAITLNKNTSDAGSTGGTGTILSNATSMTIDATPTRTGYTVEGYYTAASDGVKIAAANGTLQANVTVSSTSWTNGSGVWQNVGAKTFYTYWSPIEYLIEYNKNGSTATGTMEDQEFVYGTAQNLSKCEFTREGFTFSGWATTEGGSKVYDDEEEVNNLTTTEDDIITLYAKWTPKNYKLTVGSPNHVTIDATPEDKSKITEGNYDETVPCDAIITLGASVDDGYTQAGWKITKDADGSDVTEDYLYDETTMFMPPFAATITATMYTDYVFSCAELTLTPHLVTDGTPIFITSTANKKVRSQDYITITGNGLTPSTALTFPSLNSKFEVLTSTGGTISTDTKGEINVNAYIFYTPAADATTDGLDEIAGITVSVGGTKPKQVSLVQNIIGRHLPAEFVIAGKKDNKWYALPSNMASTGTPAPSEIAVNDINNPSIAYTAASNIYGLAGPTASNISGGNGQYVRLTMSIDDGNDPAGPAPLYGSGEAQIGKSGKSKATSDLSAGWWWALTQKNTSISNPQDAKYRLTCPNNGNTLSIKNSPFVWGQYASGVEELRLIPASSIVFAEAEVVEWGQHKAILEVDATGISATKVKAILNGDESAKITLSQTLTSVNSGATKYNYTANFGDDIDFADEESNGAMMTLEWYNSSDVLVAVSNIIVPKIIASSATMSSLMATDDPWSKAEVHVLPGVTLTANAGDFESKDVVIDRLEIYPGATVNVTKGSQDVGTLKVRTLVLRNGWTRVSSKSYDVARLYVPTDASLAKNANDNVWYSDWYIDYDQYYPIAVPFPVATSSIFYKNTKSTATAGVRLRYYSGELRATNIQQHQEQNWVEYTWGGTMPTNLEPSKGYIMTAKRPTGKAFSIVRMPMTFTNDWTTGGEKGVVSGTHKDQVTVTAWGDANTPSYAKGWNIIANPYMALHKGALSYADASGDAIEYANIPDISFKEYDQLPILTTKLAPASAFLVQAPKTGTVTFGATARVVSAPSYKTESTPVSSKQKAYIELSNEEANDMMGLIISDQYTADYEINADLEKLLGDGTSLKTYMRYDDRNMAYVAINKVLAQEWIPVNVRLPQTGEYTFSLHEASIAGELEGVYLIDYTSNEVTNLIENSYVFTATAGTISNRFAINATVGERQTPTDIDVVNGGGDLNSDRPIKFLYRDKVYIWHRGVIYDATGKKVR